MVWLEDDPVHEDDHQKFLRGVPPLSVVSRPFKHDLPIPSVDILVVREIGRSQFPGRSFTGRIRSSRSFVASRVADPAETGGLSSVDFHAGDFKRSASKTSVTNPLPSALT